MRFGKITTEHDSAARFRIGFSMSREESDCDRLFDSVASKDPAGKWKRQWSAIGFEGRVSPIPLVLHFEGIAFTQYFHVGPPAVIANPPNIEERLERSDLFGKIAQF